jgi:hypothetical protein
MNSSFRFSTNVTRSHLPAFALQLFLQRLIADENEATPEAREVFAVSLAHHLTFLQFGVAQRIGLGFARYFLGNRWISSLVSWSGTFHMLISSDSAPASCKARLSPHIPSPASVLPSPASRALRTTSSVPLRSSALAS